MKPLKPIALAALLTASIALPLFAQGPPPQQPPGTNPNNPNSNGNPNGSGNGNGYPNNGNGNGNGFPNNSGNGSGNGNGFPNNGNGNNNNGYPNGNGNNGNGNNGNGNNFQNPNGLFPKPNTGPVKAPTGSNPLLLPMPDDTNPIPQTPTLFPSPLFSDYRRPADPQAPSSLAYQLPVFGYDFFQSARDLIDAHRAYLRRKLDLAWQGGGNNPNNPNTIDPNNPNGYGSNNPNGNGFPNGNNNNGFPNNNGNGYPNGNGNGFPNNGNGYPNGNGNGFANNGNNNGFPNNNGNGFPNGNNNGNGFPNNGNSNGYPNGNGNGNGFPNNNGNGYPNGNGNGFPNNGNGNGFANNGNNNGFPNNNGNGYPSGNGNGLFNGNANGNGFSNGNGYPYGNGFPNNNGNGNGSGYPLNFPYPNGNGNSNGFPYGNGGNAPFSGLNNGNPGFGQLGGIPRPNLPRLVPNPNDPNSSPFGGGMQNGGYPGGAGQYGGSYGGFGQGAPNAQRPVPDFINAYEDVADPLAQLYRNVNASVPANYQLAASDTLSIRYWSARHEAKTIIGVVDAQGTIAIEELGLVTVRGLTLEQAEKALQERLRRYYTGVEVSVTLAKLRTIQVTVSGAAYQPGTYTVPAIATAYNLIYAAGGPTWDGSLRNIEVRRAGKPVGTLDLYKFLLVGGNAADLPLQSGDLIYIPHWRSRIAVSGEVLQPALFELRPDETLKEALAYAGGVKASGVAQRLRISTLVPGKARVLKDIDLAANNAADKTPLYDGDAVEIFSVRPLLTNTVSIEGAVDQPSTYALAPGMKISDLIERARGPISEAYLVRANLFRWNPNNTTSLMPIDLDKALAHDPKADIGLERWDRLVVYTRDEVAWTGQRSVSIRGSIKRPGVYSQSDNMRVSDLLLMAGGPTPDAFRERAVLLHQRGDGTFSMDYVNLNAIQKNDKTKDPLLEDNDILAIYKVGEAQFEPEHTVTISGEVVAAGPYPRTEGMKLSDLLNMSGGFKPNAGATVQIAHARSVLDGPNSTLKITSVKFDTNHLCADQDNVILQDGDVITVQGVGGYQPDVYTVTVTGAVNKPGPIILTGKTMRLSEALRAAGGLRPEAFPQGAEFYRDPKMLSTNSQRGLATVIGQLNDVLNLDTYNRERGKSYVERIQQINAAPNNDSILPTQTPAAPVNPNVGGLVSDLAKQELVSPARRLTDDMMNANGNIAVNLPEALRHPSSSDDILLLNGDTITIPETPTTIQVVGAVFHGRGVLYKPGAKLDYYITQAGGFAPDSAKDRIEIIHVGGGLTPAAKAGALQPGDVILVPTRVLAEKISTNRNNVNDILRTVTSSALLFKLFGL